MNKGTDARESISIELRRIEDLFSASVVDPFHPDYQIASGMDQIAARLGVMRLRRELNIRICLPASAPRPDDLDTAVRGAITRYCDAAISAARAGLAARRRAIQRHLGVGVLILGISLALGAGVSNLQFLSAGIRTLLSNAISILGTVALWSPIDAWLFGLGPFHTSIRIHTAIRNAAVEVAAP